jgi:hypothetical protein
LLLLQAFSRLIHKHLVTGCAAYETALNIRACDVCALFLTKTSTMTFGKKDMSFVHYRWDVEDEKSEPDNNDREPSRKTFDPFNGDQVLFLINFCATAMNQFSVKDGRNLENKIAYKLPVTLKSERSVFNWLMQSFDGKE